MVMKHLFSNALVLLLVFTSLPSEGQSFILDERTTLSTFNYYNEISMISRSLNFNKLNPKINFVEGNEPNKEEFKRLAEKFQKHVPKTFLIEGADVIAHEQFADSLKYIKWTYGTLDSLDQFTIYGQLIVYLQVDNKKGRIYFPKVISFEFLGKDEIQGLDENKIRLAYGKWLKGFMANPPPPPPPARE